MLYRLINGVFRGDEDADQKRDLIAEAAGCAALGYATKLGRPKALVFFGPTAENGKSQILDAMRGLLPKSRFRPSQ
jgi:phage/plasmid-associated DNA primase